MLTIVITVVIMFVTIILLVPTKLNTHEIAFVALGIIFIGIAIATGPIYGYHEKVLEQEIELAQLSEDVYATRYANDVYLYKYKVENISDKGQSYETDIIRENVIETESENCEKPVLRRYIKEAKTGLFSFCWEQEILYEFYVPIGTIEQVNYSLN